MRIPIRFRHRLAERNLRIVPLLLLDQLRDGLKAAKEDALFWRDHQFKIPESYYSAPGAEWGEWVDAVVEDVATLASMLTERDLELADLKADTELDKEAWLRRVDEADRRTADARVAVAIAESDRL